MAIQQHDGHASIAEDVRWGREELLSMKSEVSALATDVALLLEKERQLAQAEMKEQVGLAAKAAGFGFGAIELAVLAMVFLFLTVMLALSTALPMWLSAFLTLLLITGMAGACGYLAYMQAKRISPLPKRFAQSIKEDLAWARNQMS